MVLSIRKIFLLLCILYGATAVSQNTQQNLLPQQDLIELSDLLDKKQFGSAYALSNKLLLTSTDPSEKANLFYYRAYAALQLDNADAEILYQNFLLQYPEHPKASTASFDLGNYYYQKKDYNKAIASYKNVNDNKLSKSERTDLYFRNGYANFTQKNFEEALIWFDKIKNTDNKYTFAACYYAGYCELKSKKYQPALVDLQKAETNKDYADLVQHLIATVYYQQANYDQVIAYVPSKLEQEGMIGKGEMLQMLADSYYQKRDYKKASENFSLMMKEGGSFSRELKYRVGFCHYKNQVFPDAIKVLKDVAGQEDTLGQSGAYYLGLSYLQTQDKTLALTSFDIAKRSDFNPKTKEEAWFLYCKLLVDKGDYHAAIASIKAFTNQFNGGVHQEEINDLLSQSYSRTKNYSEFIAWYESSKKKSLVMNRDYQRNTFYKGTEHYNNDQYQEALMMFNRSITVPQDNDLLVAANFWKGEIYSIRKEYPDAIASYEEVFDKTADPGHPYRLKAHYSSGYAYYNSKDYDKALFEFKQYISKTEKKKPANYDDVLIRVGDLYFQKRNYSEALSSYNKAIAANGRDVDYALFQKGIILLREDKQPEAKNCFVQILDKYPGSLYREGAIYKKAEIDFLQNNLDQAVAGFSQLIGNKVNNHPYEPDALMKRATIYSDQGKNEEALKDYLAILDSYYNLPIHEDALRGAQALYAKLERSSEFEAKLAEFKERNPNSNVLQDVDYEAARNLFFEQKYSKALPSFTAYLNKYPESASAADARYYQAESYFQTGEKEKAKAGFEKVLAERTSAFTGKAVQRLAEITQANGDLASANKYYSTLLVNSKTKREKNAALAGLASNYLVLQRYDSSELYATELIKFNLPNTSQANKGNMILAKSAYQKGNYEKAEDYLLEIINNDKEELAAEAQYLIAESLYKQKKYKSSTEACYELNNNYSQYEYWLGKSYILIAENLVAQNELLHAKATLKSVIENTLDEKVKAQATLRLGELNAATEKESKEKGKEKE